MIGCIALRLVFVYRVAEAQEKFPYTVGKLCWSKSIEADGRIEWEIPEGTMKYICALCLAEKELQLSQTLLHLLVLVDRTDWCLSRSQGNTNSRQMVSTRFSGRPCCDDRIMMKVIGT